VDLAAVGAQDLEREAVDHDRLAALGQAPEAPTTRPPTVS
jgi:hypothetical protein